MFVWILATWVGTSVVASPLIGLALRSRLAEARVPVAAPTSLRRAA
jgi:hypothetical protein